MPTARELLDEQRKILRVGQRVTLEHSHTQSHSGIITAIEIRYIIKEDGGFSFLHDAANVKPEEPR